MSSMVSRALSVALLASCALCAGVPALAQDGEDWDKARAQLIAREPGPMAQAVARWEQLAASPAYGFNDYAAFVLAYPGFPDEDKLRGYAEKRLETDTPAQPQLIAFFDHFAPLTNQGRAQYALALRSQRPQQAAQVARQAWRGGQMSEAAYASIAALYGATFTPDDQDARMDALLWQRDRAAAERQLPLVSPARAGVFAARLAILQGADGTTVDPTAHNDPGYLYNRSRELRTSGRTSEAAAILAARLPLARLPLNPEAWVDEQLAVARQADARLAVAIAGHIDEAFAPGTDISQLSYGLRDDYTSLMWLAGTRATWDLHDPIAAAALFYRYGAAARTPQTRSKGFFWAANAMANAGDTATAQRYYELAAQYGDRYYGLLALERLGRTPTYPPLPAVQPTPDERARFLSAPLTAAVAEVARDAPWSVGIRFYRAMASQPRTVGEHVLVADYAREIGRRDLAVNLSDFAGEHGQLDFTRIGFPTMPAPAGSNWTMVHAIARQESQFAQNAVSHAGARGIMQLMPGTAEDEARKAGIAYMSASLVSDATYNAQLGNNYFERVYARYNSYPLAIAAYNAGPGNVNKWLAQNGDPRTGSIGWIEWIERIPIQETRNYVQRVLENAAVYEALYPQKAPYGRARKLSEFLH